MVHLTNTILALLSVFSVATALPEPQIQSVGNDTTLEARKTQTSFVFNENPPKGKCRLSSYISKINHAVGWRVVSSDGSFISSGSCSYPMCTSPLLGLGDSIAVLSVNNAMWRYEFMRSGTVSGDRWMSTDTNRCTMFPDKPMGDASVTVTCDFDCSQKYDWPLQTETKGPSTITVADTNGAEVAAPLALPSGLSAPPST